MKCQCGKPNFTNVHSHPYLLKCVNCGAVIDDRRKEQEEIKQLHELLYGVGAEFKFIGVATGLEKKEK